MSDDDTETDGEKKNILDYIKFFVKQKIDLEYFEYEYKVDEEGEEHTLGGGVPLPFGLKAKSKISERTAQTGLEFGD